MQILLVGLNHQTAPVELREQLALTGCALTMALEDLSALIPLRHGPPRDAFGGLSATLHEGVILSTCNRLEIYAVAASAQDGWAALESFLSRLQGISLDDLKPHLYHLDGRPAIEHLMRVAAGLDSMILGEPQILGQVADALEGAEVAATSGPILSHLFTQAVHAGKRARTETDISRHTTSVSHAAALLAQEKVGDLAAASVLVVGAGEMAELAARALRDQGAQTITCINRTYARAEALAQELGGSALNWYHLPEALTQADIVITATGAPHIVIQTDDVKEALPRREGRPLLFVDIAVPRDVEASVGDLPGVYCYDIDDLQSTVDENLTQRQAAIPQVEVILEEETGGCLAWLRSREVVPVIADLREKAALLVEAEVEQALNRLEGLSPQEREVIRRMGWRIVNKLLHEPTVRLKAYAANGDGYSYAHALRELFALNGLESTAPDEVTFGN